MKKIIAVLILLSTHWLCGQCSLDSFVIQTQQELDSIAFLYKDCEVIKGDLSIKPKDHKTTISFENWSFLKKLGGNLDIRLSQLSDFSGLDSLSEVTGNITLNDLPVKSFNGLQNLKKIGGGFFIDDLYYIGNFEGLNSLEIIDSSFIVFNDYLKNFEGLTNLKFIGYDFYCESKSIMGFVGLERLERIGGSLHLEDLGSVVNFKGLENLKFIGEDLNLSGSRIRSFHGLENLATIGGSLEAEGSLLSNFQGLSSLQYISEVYLESNKLKSFKGLYSINEINRLSINDCRKIRTFTGLESLKLLGSLFMSNCRLSEKAVKTFEVRFVDRQVDCSSLVVTAIKFELDKLSLETFGDSAHVIKINMKSICEKCSIGPDYTELTVLFNGDTLGTTVINGIPKYGENERQYTVFCKRLIHEFPDSESLVIFLNNYCEDVPKNLIQTKK